MLFRSLLDTYHTRLSGIPTAMRLIEKYPERLLSVRPDFEPTQVGDVHLIISNLQERNLDAGINLSGGFDDTKTQQFLDLADSRGFPRSRMAFLYGEFALKAHVPLPARSGPAAVLKLCESGGKATMKISDGKNGLPGPKSSKPARPVVWRLHSPDGSMFATMPIGIIGQEGETPPEGYQLLSGVGQTFGNPLTLRRFRDTPPINSPATDSLVARCIEDRDAAIAASLTQR